MSELYLKIVLYVLGPSDTGWWQRSKVAHRHTALAGNIILFWLLLLIVHGWDVRCGCVLVGSMLLWMLATYPTPKTRSDYIGTVFFLPVFTIGLVLLLAWFMQSILLTK